MNEIKALYDKAQDEMKESFQAEMKGDGQTYVDKLEEKMINNAAKAPEEEAAAGSQVALVNGSVLVKQGKDEKDEMVKLRYNVKGHFDSVREMFYLDQLHVLASVSEDCQVHLWNLKNIATESDRIVSSHEQLNLESFCTLRGHKGAIYSVTGIHGVGALKGDSADTEKHSSLDRVLFTAGQEGVIKVWSTPNDQRKDDKYPVTKGVTYQIGELGQSSNEPQDVPIWCLRYNSFTHKLLSIKYDNLIQVWNCGEFVEKV